MNRLYKVLYTILLALGFHLCFFGFKSAKLISPGLATDIIILIYLFAFLSIVNLYIDIRGKIRKLLSKVKLAVKSFVFMKSSEK